METQIWTDRWRVKERQIAIWRKTATVETDRNMDRQMDKDRQIERESVIDCVCVRVRETDVYKCVFFFCFISDQSVAVAK